MSTVAFSSSTVRACPLLFLSVTRDWIFSFLVNFNGIATFYLVYSSLGLDQVFMEILCIATYPTTESQVRMVTFIGSTVQTVFPFSLALVRTVILHWQHCANRLSFFFSPGAHGHLHWPALCKPSFLFL